MTVSSILSRWSYTGNGATTAFAYTNRIFADSDLKVYVAGAPKALTTDYVVSGVDNPGGGNVTFVAAPANGASVVIVRDVPATQPVDYQPNDPFPAETHEKALDRATVLIQQLETDIVRSLRQSESDTSSLGTLPDSATRAGRYLGFDASGNPTTNTSFGAWKGAWATATAYIAGDVVRDGAAGADTDNVYVCVAGHTSGTWATDLAASKWQLAIDVQQIASDAAGLLGEWRGTWATTTAYAQGDTVKDGAAGADTNNVYVCITAHTADTWATDLAAGKWQLMVDVEQIVTDAIAAVPGLDLGWLVEYPIVKTYPLIQKSSFTFDVDELAGKVGGGTSVTAKLQIDGADVTDSSGTFTTTESATTPSAARRVSAGQTLALVVTAISGSPTDFSFSIACTRV